MTPRRIVVAMSGGVDSSVAAALLAEAGHDVVGISMQLYDQSDRAGGHGTCCTMDDLHDARRVAAAIGIPHYILNFEAQFRRHVLDDFVREYSRGRTPIPCTHCNADLKFSELLARADAYGAGMLATGHYARVGRDASGRCHLHRGADRAKDQSYFLFALTQDQLAHACFPVGDLGKDQVRAHAARFGLTVADKPDSQELCFVADGDYAAVVAQQNPAVTAGGAIVDTAGHVLGSHAGTHRFTVGQRKGLGLSSPMPLYVVAVDAEARQVTVGGRADLERPGLTASRVNWVSGVAPATWTEADVQIRHRHTPAPARVRALEEARAEVAFVSPQTAVSPGQAAVFYRGDEVLGGGWID